MGRRRKKQKQRTNPGSGKPGLTLDRKRRTGHYQGKYYSEVYRGGQVHVYTAWNDNDDDVGAPMDFDTWARSVGG